jgi:hypothetical protein
VSAKRFRSRTKSGSMRGSAACPRHDAGLGVAYLAEAAAGVVIVEATSISTALTVSKLMP